MGRARVHAPPGARRRVRACSSVRMRTQHARTRGLDGLVTTCLLCMYETICKSCMVMVRTRRAATVSSVGLWVGRWKWNRVEYQYVPVYVR
jgi:hypothetical protein